MKKLVAGLMAGIIALGAMGTTTVPSVAQIMTRDQAREFYGDIVPDRNDDRRFERRGNYYYYNGHRGSNNFRNGWRQYNGYWFPPAAFIAGAIVGNAIGNQAPNYGGGYADPTLTREHLAWCESQYRSYRASDNSFQPYNGPRQQCVSPYWR